MFEDVFASLPASPPRSSVLPGLTLAAAVAPRSRGLFFLCLVVILLPVVLLGVRITTRLVLNLGRTIEGRVISVLHGTHGYDCSRITYSFTPRPGESFVNTGVVCHRSPDFSAREGDPIAIRFLAYYPAVNGLADSTGLGIGVLLGPALFLLFGLFVINRLFPRVLPVMRCCYLYKYGLLATGKVVFVKIRPPVSTRSGREIGFDDLTISLPGGARQPSPMVADVFIAHDLPTGEQIEGTAWCDSAWLLAQLSPGTTVHIAFMPGHPRRLALLDAFVGYTAV